MLTARGVTVRLGSRTLLAGVDVDVAPGRITTLGGRNGSGKTTLVRVLAGDLTPSAGAVQLDGVPVAAVGAALARRRAVLTQRERLELPFTVAEVVGLGRHPHGGARRDDPAVDDALGRMGLRALRDRPVTTLSGGERQRVHLARALAQLDGGPPGTRVLLADEPTSALDPAARQEVLARLRGLADGGTAVLVVLHDLDLAARYADRMVLLAGGAVAIDGPPDEVLRSEALHDVFGTRFHVLVHPDDGRPHVVPAR